METAEIEKNSHWSKAIIHGLPFSEGQRIWLKIYMLIVLTNTN